MSISNTFKQLTLTFVALAVALPTLVNAGGFVPPEEKKAEHAAIPQIILQERSLELEDRFKDVSLISANQIAVIPQTQFVGDSFIPLYKKSTPQYQAEIKAEQARNAEALVNFLHAIAMHDPFVSDSAPFMSLSSPAAEAGILIKPVDVIETEKAIALSDPIATIVAAKPLNSQGQLAQPVADLISRIKLGKSDTAVITGDTQTTAALKAAFIANGASAQQIKTVKPSTSFQPTALELAMGMGIQVNAAPSIEAFQPSANMAAIQLMHRATLDDLSATKDTDPTIALEND